MAPPEVAQRSFRSSFGAGASDDNGSCPEVRIDIPVGTEPDVDRFLEQRAVAAGTLRCRVQRHREKNCLEMYIEEGNVFVLRATRKSSDWLIFETPLGTKERRHIARLRTHGKDRSFTCVRGRDEGGSHPPELLQVRHHTEQLSGDLPELNTMQIALPRPPLGLLDAPCGMLAMQLRRTIEERVPMPEDLAILQSRKPKWNPRSETYELPFGGRANWASARNFQLVERGGSSSGGHSDRVVLLYGKMEEDEFALGEQAEAHIRPNPCRLHWPPACRRKCCVAPSAANARVRVSCAPHRLCAPAVAVACSRDRADHVGMVAPLGGRQKFRVRGVKSLAAGRS